MEVQFPWVSLNDFHITMPYHFLTRKAFLPSRALGSIRGWGKLEFPRGIFCPCRSLFPHLGLWELVCGHRVLV